MEYLKIIANTNNSHLEFGLHSFTLDIFAMKTLQLKRLTNLTLPCAFFLLAFAPVHAQNLKNEQTLIIQNHQFEPAEIKVPANQKIKLTIQNKDNTPEEFESYSLKREKVIPGGSKVLINIGPLKPGRYEFFGEFNPATAKGVLIAE
jgi:hypothetical protein